MWKESYRLGIDSIDQQHIALFKMVEGLLRDIEIEAGKEEFQRAITFLKEYVVLHFRDEEAYQESVQYSGIEEHKKAHREFTNVVLDYERKLVESDWDLHIIKDLAGMLSAWLIYHVADADQKIAGKKFAEKRPQAGSCVESFCESARDVFEKMAGLPSSEMVARPSGGTGAPETVNIKIEVTGARTGWVLFGYSREFASEFVKNMMISENGEIDEMVCSALAEIVNIISGSTMTQWSREGVQCDIKTPEILPDPALPSAGEPSEGLLLETGIGSLNITASVQ